MNTEHPARLDFSIDASLFPGENLTTTVRECEDGQESPFDGEPLYERLFDQLARALYRRQPRHALCVGERGIGQSAVLTEFARRSCSGKIPFLRQKQFFWVDCRHVAPEESRGRLLALLATIIDRDDIVLCVDGFGELAEGNLPMLMSSLTRIRGQVIGLTSRDGYQRRFTGRPDIAEFFTTVSVEEPDLTVALKLMHHFAAGLEQQYRLTVEQDAIEQAVVLSDNFILNDRLPGKALSVLKRVCDEIDYDRTQLQKSKDQVSEQDVVRAISMECGVPEETLRGVAQQSDYAASLGQEVFGQQHAVTEVAAELGLIKSGLNDPGKPASVLLFVGPTGTGKTELAKILAQFYSRSKHLKTFTLGNFTEPHSVSGLIGVPAGYVGHDAGGRLVNELNTDPYGVFLFDEADKAHPDVMQPLLNLFDEGWIVDQRGVKAHGDKSIIILTTNVGQRQIVEMCEKGSSIEDITSRIKETLAQLRHTKLNRPVFTPEFLARLKRVVVFTALDEQAMLSIAQRFVRRMQDTWQLRRGKLLKIDPQIVNRIGELAFRRDKQSHHREGGRIVSKLITDLIETRLQQELSRQPDAYREANCVTVSCIDPDTEPLSVEVKFHE